MRVEESKNDILLLEICILKKGRNVFIFFIFFHNSFFHSFLSFVKPHFGGNPGC